jgi:hypothetical protein
MKKATAVIHQADWLHVASRDGFKPDATPFGSGWEMCLQSTYKYASAATYNIINIRPQIPPSASQKPPRTQLKQQQSKADDQHALKQTKICEVRARVPGRQGRAAAGSGWTASTPRTARTEACLNFTDSAWLLAVPASYAAPWRASCDAKVRQRMTTSSSPANGDDGQDSSSGTQGSPFELDMFDGMS